MPFDHDAGRVWNADGVDTAGVVVKDVWYLRNSNTSGNAQIAFIYGSP